MTYKQKLVSDIRIYLKQCKWQELLHDQIVQILQLKPLSPYEYIQKKISLRSKLDNSKHSSYLTELIIYCLFVNPLYFNKIQIQNKILYLCVEKYQHTKIRKNETMNIINGLFLLTNNQQKDKEYFIKMVGQEIDTQTVYVTHFAHLLACTVIYLNIKKQICQLEEKLQLIDQHLNIKILNQYLLCVSEQYSMLKKMGIKIDDENEILKVVANVVLEDQEK